MWKQIATRECGPGGHYGATLNDNLIDASALSNWLHCEAMAKNAMLRVTVEEEVNECCEKWRDALYTVPRSSGSPQRWVVRKSKDDVLLGPFVFCPECGKKL